jgi:hypothetical protein
MYPNLYHPVVGFCHSKLHRFFGGFSVGFSSDGAKELGSFPIFLCRV